MKRHLYALILLLAGTADAQAAEWSANIGWASDYYFRGILQKSSSASGGIDFSHQGFYAGVWAADVGELTGNGLEVDGYFGYTGEVGDFNYGVGYTGYYYTGDFDDTYHEVNLSAAWKFITFDAAIGEYNNFGLADQNYQFYSLTLQHNGFYGKYGTFNDEFDGAYFEAGYGTSIAEFDVTFYGLYSDENLVGEATEALVFTIGKTFDLN
jgi:uncharacterized protein (TIGR02001 family)